MNEQEWKNRVQKAVDHRLSGLQENPFLAQRIIASEKGEEPVVKKKISVSLVAVLVIMILTLSIGYALVQSRITSEMYGREPVPQEVAEKIQLVDQNAASELGTLSVDELLYDGNALHASFTVANPGSETLLYTIDGIWLDDSPLTRSTLLMEGAGSYGLLLGGTVDGTAMPASSSVYNKAEAIYQYDENGKYLGFAPLPEGEATFRIAVAVWKPLNPPALVDYAAYEGFDVTETADHLVTDGKGQADLELFRPAEYDLNATADQRSSDVYAQAFEALGWAKLAERIEVEVKVTLDPEQLSRVSPAQNEYQLDDLKLTIDRFDLTHAGGSMEGWIEGDQDAVNEWMAQGIYLADPEGNRVLNYGCWCDWDEAANRAHFTLAFDPVAGELPGYVDLAPFVAHDPRWDEHSISYNPDVQEPENVIGAFRLDLSRAIRIELENRN